MEDVTSSSSGVPAELKGHGQVLAVGFLASLALAIEGPRVAAQVRLNHLRKHSKEDLHQAGFVTIRHPN